MPQMVEEFRSFQRDVKQQAEARILNTNYDDVQETITLSSSISKQASETQVLNNSNTSTNWMYQTSSPPSTVASTPPSKYKQQTGLTTNYNAATKDSSSSSALSINPSNILKTIGQIAESDEVQVAILFLIFFDLISSSGLLVLSDWNDGSDEITSTFLCKFLHSVTIFTLFSFLLELIALILSFGVKRFFMHKGYALDFCVILICLCVEMYISSILGDEDSNAVNRGMVTAGKEVRLLGFVRVWRIVRIVESTVSKSELQHQSAKSILEEQLLQMEELRVSLTWATERAKRETDARRQVEKMLQHYKEEVDILNEALKLAAIDLASPRRSETVVLPPEINKDYLPPPSDESYVPEEVKQPPTIVIAEDGTYYETSKVSRQDQENEQQSLAISITEDLQRDQL